VKRFSSRLRSIMTRVSRGGFACVNTAGGDFPEAGKLQDPHRLLEMPENLFELFLVHGRHGEDEHEKGEEKHDQVRKGDHPGIGVLLVPRRSWSSCFPSLKRP
jgi:hypothetical protein